MNASRTSDTSPARSRLLWWLSLLALFIFSLLLLWKVVQFRHQLTDFRDRQQSLVTKADSLLEVLRQQPEPEELRTLMSSYDIRQLKEKGLPDPVDDLQTDLAGHPELIPHEGVLGGTMHFYKDEIYVLTDRWVLAYYEDGHISGYAWMQYTVKSGSRITWNVLDSYIR